jgi:hypothetical protein
MEFDYRKLYEVNQWLKNSPYWYDFKEKLFISADEQSDIYVQPKGSQLESPSGERFMYVEDGKTLYKFVNENKTKDAVASLSETGITLNGATFPVKYTDEPFKSRLTDVPWSRLEEHDCSSMSLWYNREHLKDGPILIGDIIDLIEFKKSIVQNEFLFMELERDQIHIFESKLGLSLRNKTLICLSNFFRLKTKKRDTIEFMTMHSGDSRLYVHYGNSEHDVVFKFHVHDLNTHTH